MPLTLVTLTLAAALAPTGPASALMPWPAAIRIDPAELPIGPSFRVGVAGKGGPLVERAARRLERRLARQTGLALPAPGPAAGKPVLEIRCEAPGRSLPHLGMDESYRLAVTAEGATLHATEPWGVLRGIETFLQLVSPGRSSEFRVPALAVEDRPRFPWRGLLLDSGRHFMSLDTVKRTLDGMAAVKLNVLHWHLTDDQGFRVESRRRPALHRMGSDGLYYTQAEIKDVVRYAGERGIRVVPEFDVPGHTTSWLVGHPELAANPGPYSIERRWGIMKPALDPTKEEVYHFLDGFFGEMARLFPDEFVHIGGDEVKGEAWDASERVAAFKKQKGLGTNHDLQSYFNGRLSRIVNHHGKQMMGWDEILHPDLPRETVVHSWRGQESLGAAARQGLRCVLSHGYYIDLVWPAERHYAVDPHDKGVDQLSEAERARVLGGEATMWSEFVDDETVDSRIWPRTAAIAERLWSPREVKDATDMYARLDAVSRWLEFLGLGHRSGPALMLARLAGPQADELGRLAKLVEPLEDYQRSRTRVYTQQTPLNRLVDAVPPESDEARRFASAVAALLADPARQNGREAVRARLEEWRGLDARLRALLESRELIHELVPLAGEASALAAVGLEALGFIEQRTSPPESWRAERASLLEPPRNPPHALEVAYRAAVKRLVEAAEGRP